MSAAFPDRAPSRPIWLITLADLALLLVGFFVFLQANQKLPARALADGLRQGFGIAAPQPTGTPAAPASPMPVAAAAMLDFAPGSAALPSSPASLAAWARAALADPRVSLRVAGYASGGADTDPASQSAALLAADRARAVAAALVAAGVAADRLTITSGPANPPRRAVIVTLAFTGNP